MKKRKHAGVFHNRSATAKRGAKNRSVDLAFDDVESGESDDEVAAGKSLAAAKASAEPEETADEKRVRVAKEFLERLAQSQAEDRENDSGADDEFFERGIIGGEKDDILNQKLLEDALEKAGKASVELAEKLWTEALVPHCRSFRAHKLPVTCVAISDDGSIGFSGSKDCTIIRWDLDTGKRTAYLTGRRSTKNHRLDPKTTDFNTDQVLCLALSDDNEYLASGGKDRILRIWNPSTGRFVDKFKGHLDDINGMAFQKGGTHNLYTGSSDRTIKVWNIKDMAYVETLYGHQDQVYAVDSHRKERCISAGHDETARLWKIPEEVQLILRERKGVSLDCLAMINDQYFVTGSNEGTLSLWDIGKKKPIFSVRNAHAASDEDEADASDADEAADDKGGPASREDEPAWPERSPAHSAEPNWISALAAIRNGDVVASGSCDGFVRLWRCTLSVVAPDGSPQRRSLSLLCAVEVPGFVNGLAFSKAGDRLLVGAGQEHRLGRWWRNSNARNSVWIIDFQPPQFDDADVDEDSSSAEEDSSQGQ